MKKFLYSIIAMLITTMAAFAQDYPVKYGADVNVTHGTHYPKTVSIKGTQSDQYIIENIATAPKCAAYFDKTSTVFKVKAGDIVTPDITINGSWIHCYVFVDWNANKAFDVNLEGTGPYTTGIGNELMCWSLYSKTGDGQSGWNSDGSAVSGDIPLSPGSFRIPRDAQQGMQTRLRYMVAWNCIDPSGNYANFISDGGCIIDVTLEIDGTVDGVVTKYPINEYDEPTVDATIPQSEWEAITSGLHCTWASRNELYMKHRVPQLTETTNTEITAWKGERANLEAVLFSKTDQGTLHLAASGDAASWISVRYLNYVITDDGRGCGNHNFSLTPWLVPDVIEQDKPKAINAMETRPVWCSIQVPRDAQAGKHTAQIQVLNEQNQVVKTLNLTINVDSHSLPAVADQKFHLDLWQQPYSVSRYYECERWSPEHIEALRPYIQALAQAGQKVVSTILFYEPWGEQTHDKFSPMIQTTKKSDGTWTFDYTNFDKYVELCAEYGITDQINCYSMVTWDMSFRYFDEASSSYIDWALTVGSTDYNNLWNAYLQAFRTHLEVKGWFNKTCIAMDERSESQMLAAYEIIKANGFKMALAGNYHSSLNDKLYDFCVALTQGNRFTQAERQYRKQNNLITTVYTSCAESEPNIYSNSLPAEAAFLPIHVAANDLDGYLHWSWINWDEHPLTDTRFRKFGAGDTYCYYPGNRSSVRFERLVEGIHQFEKIQILKEEYKNDSQKLSQLNKLLAECKDYTVSGSECAKKVQRIEDFLNGLEVEDEGTISGYWKIKVDDTHYAKAAANQTQWSTEISSQTSYDLFRIEGTYDACTIKLMGRSNNIGPDKNNQLFVDQTTSNKYSIIDCGNGKVKLRNNGYWVYVSNGTFTFNTSNATQLQLEYVMDSQDPVRTTLFSTMSGGMDIPPYRIPGITCGKDGRLYASAARLVCGTDPGYGQVDCVVKISNDNGTTWSSQEIDVAVGDASLINNVKTPMQAAYGDPAIVADRESDEVLVMAVGGCTVYTYSSTNRNNPNIIAAIRSTDGGETWQTPVEQTEMIYGLFDSGNPIAAAFVGGGRLFQSRIVKVGQYYRLYAALAARPNGNRVIYSDDFGRTWKALGGASATPVPNGDEPKCEEFPDGRVIITSRVGGGRLLNVYTYTNTATGEGTWETQTKSTMSGLSASPSTNPTNGEMLIVPVLRNSDQKPMYLALQSVPTGSNRVNVGIFYKELNDLSDIQDISTFADEWNGFYQVSTKASAYSSMELQADDKIGFFYEETLTKWGTKPNPVSTSFPTGSGSHNFDGFENIYVPLGLELITGGRYSVNRNINRGEYVRSYFTQLVNASSLDSDTRQQAMTLINALGDNPTTTQVDAINKLLAGAEPADPWDGKTLTFQNIQQNGTKYTLYINNNDILSNSTDTPSMLGDKAQFICSKEASGKYSFFNPASNLYMIWRAGSNYGYNNNTGTLDNYNATYCDWSINSASSTKADTYYIVSKRNNGTTDGSLILLSSGTFDSYSNAIGWTSGYSNLYYINATDTPTGISQTETITNHKPNVIYNLNGQKLTTPRRGINIIDGKKVIY